MRAAFFKIFFLSFALLASTMVFSQDSTQSITARVYFIRNTSILGALSGFNVFIDEKFVCKINEARYSIHDVAPGKHNFSVQFDGKKSRSRAEKLELNLEAGKTYYIELVIKVGVIVSTVYCRQMDEKTGATKTSAMKQDQDCEVKE